MNRFVRAMIPVLVLCLVFPAGAMAEGISFDGTITAASSVEVTMPAGGTVETVYVQEGQRISANDRIVTLKTEKVYADQDGTVSGIFAQPGDDVESVVNQFGAVLYLEGTVRCTISASTSSAYNAAENKYIHTGETVYLQGYSDSSLTGYGRVTAVSGSNYTVEITSGDFQIGDSINIFRGDEAKTTARIGRGKASRVEPVAVTGSGSIVSFAVENGEKVKRGDLLFETLSEGYEDYSMPGTTVYAPVDGVVASCALSQGTSAQKGSTAVVIYPADAMCVTAQITESDLAEVSEGMEVAVELMAYDGVRYNGTITAISGISGAGDEETGEALYDVTVAFTTDDAARYGMTVLVTVQ